MLTIKENYNDVDEFNLLYNAVGFIKRIDANLGYGMILKD